LTTSLIYNDALASADQLPVTHYQLLIYEMLTILGLGPGDAGLMTREAWDVLSAAVKAGVPVLLRTRKHPTVDGLPAGLALRDFDALYESGNDFAEVYARIVDGVIEAAQAGDAIYAVPGHPLVGEATVPSLLQRARDLGIATRIVSGLSFIEPVLEGVQEAMLAWDGGEEEKRRGGERGVDAIDGLQICDAVEIAAMHHPPLNPDRPALIAQVYSRAIASDLKLTLMNQYPPGHKVWIVRGRDVETSEPGSWSPARTSFGSLLVSSSPLYQLDHRDVFDHLTSLYVPAMPLVTAFEGLQETVAFLRAPEGCPWDRAQTHESMRADMLEELYEVLDALDTGDLAALREELGDLLLNILLQVQIATEAEEFRMVDVIAEIDAKLKRRHPHVFGDVVVNDVGEVLTNWNAIKQQEYATNGRPARESAIDGVPPALPALAQAQKLAHKAERAGFSFDSSQQRLAKAHEELDEILAAADDEQRKEELGDLLFTLADFADGFKLDAEIALREANLKFSRRYRAMETLLRERNQDMKALNAEERLALWREVKG
jgi:tetrapyrrole methylase family protein / MazG family protein